MKLGIMMRSFILLLLATCAANNSSAREPVALSALDLVSSDAAFCLEVPNLHENLDQLESSVLFGRLRKLPYFRQFLESEAAQHWKAVENRVTNLTGKNISEQFRALFAKSLVLAIYVPSGSVPQGILGGEARDAGAIHSFLDTWMKIEPGAIVIRKTHRGDPYLERKRHPNAKNSVFFASSDQWFAMSDHEILIQNVIDRFNATTGRNSAENLSGSLKRSTNFSKKRERLKQNGLAYVHLNSRQWDQSLEEMFQDSFSRFKPIDTWKQIRSISAGLHFNQGLVCDTVIDLDPSKLTEEWSQFVTSAAAKTIIENDIPADALVAISGQLNLPSFVKAIQHHLKPADQSEFVRKRRLIQSLFGGQDLFDNLLPTIARDFHGFLISRIDDRTKRVILDGTVGFSVDKSADPSLLQSIARGLDTSLSMLAACTTLRGEDVTLVHREQTDMLQIQWLSESAPFPLAVGNTGQRIAIAGSREQLLKTLTPQPRDLKSGRLGQCFARYFPNASQLVWMDTVMLRHLLNISGSDIAHFLAQGSEVETKRLIERFRQAESTLSLFDAVFVAGRIEPDNIRITFGGGLDAK